MQGTGLLLQKKSGTAPSTEKPTHSIIVIQKKAKQNSAVAQEIVQTVTLINNIIKITTTFQKVCGRFYA
jgi:hypothetical protein